MFQLGAAVAGWDFTPFHPTCLGKTKSSDPRISEAICEKESSVRFLQKNPSPRAFYPSDGVRELVAVRNSTLKRQLNLVEIS